MCWESGLRKACAEPAPVYISVLSCLTSSSDWSPLHCADKSILEEKPYFPKFLSPVAVNLIKLLLVKDERHRLGSGVGGIKEVISHPWFKTINWTELVHKRTPVPFKPSIRSPEDTSNFDEVEEEEHPPRAYPDCQDLLDDVF